LNAGTVERKSTFDLNALNPEEWKRKRGKSIRITKQSLHDSWNAGTVVKKGINNISAPDQNKW